VSAPDDKLSAAAERAAARKREEREAPEPSLASRLGQIGVLGWAIVAPVLLSLLVGRWLDHRLNTGVFFSAPAVMLGACLGLWAAWRWMRKH
jgi:ATP synthase protein I